MKQLKWEKPQLVVLVRGRPEEAVLGTCKFSGSNGPGNDGTCHYTVGAQCDAIGVS